MSDYYLDIHTHIVPNLDDGASDQSMAVKMLRQAKDNGVKGLVMTTHYCPFRWKWDLSRYREEAALLQEQAQAYGLQLYTGNEIYYSSKTLETLEQGKCLTLNDTRYVLIEFPLDIYGTNIKNSVITLRQEGYLPVIAHAERYGALASSETLLQELIDCGAYIQVNCGGTIKAHKRSLRPPAVRSWMKKGLVHFIASDTHDTETRPSQMKECARILEKYYGAELTQKILYQNPLAMLADQYVTQETEF